MIKAELKTKGEDDTRRVSFSGSTEEIVGDLCDIIVKGAEVLSELISHEEGEETSYDYDQTFYGIIMTAIDAAQEEGHEINREQLGLAMMLNKALEDLTEEE